MALRYEGVSYILSNVGILVSRDMVFMVLTIDIKAIE